MIQIQNDNINPTAAVSKPVLDPVSDANPVEDSSSSNVAPVSASAPVSNDNTDIDQLLADLDKLSKELDEKDDHAESKEETPISQGVVSNPPAENDVKDDQEKPTAEGNEPKTGEEFDFDAFLSDLEKKIDQETEKKDAATESQPLTDDSESNFRQNRVAPKLEEEEQDKKEQVDVKDTELSDITDMVDFPMRDEDKLTEPATPIANQAESKSSNNSSPEDLKSQNIFDMLGLTDISNEEKDSFLDELEDMIWSDFTMHDLQLILTAEEYAGAKAILDKAGDEAQKKEDLIVYLDKLIPDLDEVLYEKALELKSEMVGERLKQLKSKGSNLEEIKEAEDLISQNRWKSAVSLLNQLS